MNKNEVAALVRQSDDVRKMIHENGLRIKIYEPAWESIARLDIENEGFIKEEEPCLEYIWLAYIVCDDGQYEFFVTQSFTPLFYAEATYKSLKQAVIQNRSLKEE